MIGRIVSNYEITEKLGSGGMGEVYKARDRRLNRFVALKILAGGELADPEQRKRFLLEAQSASALNHPNIVVIYDVITQNDADYLVMEYVSGKMLRDLIPKTGLPSSQVLRYGIQIADAMVAAHAAGILHRDLKPANVMVTDAGAVKLLDFGLAKLMSRPPLGGDPDATDTVDTGPKTAAGTILGTASYMSPEQIEGKPLDGRSDIFSFGLVLYEMVTGRRAFQGDSAITTLTAVLRDEPSRIAELVQDAPPQLERLINRCLRKDPAQRWQTMQDLHAALTGLKEDIESGSITISRRHAAIAPPKDKRRMIGIAAGFIVTLGLTGGGIWVWMRSHSSPDTPATSAQVSAPATPPVPADSKPPGPDPNASKPVEEAKPLATKQAEADAAAAAAAKAQQTRPQKTALAFVQPKISPLQPAPEPSAEPVPLAPAPVVKAEPVVNVPTPTVSVIKKVNVPDGTKVVLMVAQDVPSGIEVGGVVHLEVKEPLRIGDDVVIAKGARASGVIGESGRRALFLGKKNKVAIILDTADAVDGNRVKLRASLQSPDPGKSRKPVEVTPTPTTVGSKEVVLTKGVEITAFVDGNADVKTKSTK
jgi:serine/threonine protein kinase